MAVKERKKQNYSIYTRKLQLPLLEEKLQTIPDKFVVPKILDTWMHNLCNFPEFSFGVHVQPGQARPKFLIVIT